MCSHFAYMAGLPNLGATRIQVPENALYNTAALLPTVRFLQEDQKTKKGKRIPLRNLEKHLKPRLKEKVLSFVSWHYKASTLNP